MMLLTKAGPVFVWVLLFSATVFFPAAKAATDTSDDTNKILHIIETYERALNASDVTGAVSLYSVDGVFMPAGKPSAAGREEIQRAYLRVFKELDFDVVFHVDEIVVSGELAYVRTASDGKIKPLGKNSTIINNSRELFILQKVDGVWKITRYLFNDAALQAI